MSADEGDTAGGLHLRKPATKPKQTDLLARAAAAPAPVEGREQPPQQPVTLHRLLGLVLFTDK